MNVNEICKARNPGSPRVYIVNALRPDATALDVLSCGHFPHPGMVTDARDGAVVERIAEPTDHAYVWKVTIRYANEPVNEHRVWCAEFLADYGYGEQRTEFLGVFSTREAAINYVENSWDGKFKEFSGELPSLEGDTWGSEYADKTVTMWQEVIIGHREACPA